MGSIRVRHRSVTVAPWALDAALSAAAFGVTAYRIDTGAVEAGGRAPDAAAYGIGLAMAVALLARRRWPACVLGVVTVLWIAYHARGYPGGAPGVPVWAALYSVAVAPRRWAGLVLAGVLIVSDASARSEGGAHPFDALLDGTTVVFAAMLLLGDAVRSRRERRAEYEARLEALAARQEDAAARRVAEERIRIARDLHDVSAHTIAVIGVQANVAAELLTEDPETAGEALRAIRAAGAEAMAELRATVGVLRDEDGAEAEAPAPGLDRLPDLVRSYGSAGPRVELGVEGERRPLPGVVELTAYRIVQESLANALRHGGAGAVEVRLRYRADGLDVEVVDDGRGGAPAGDGYGVRGMAERAAALGGSLTAGPAGGPGESGFRVRAWLPCGGTR
ncbi:histidine kinase [Actinomadura nitritigenes]|uniref:histidine kinase n=1 Tax=Actinomadura nitritigenes TaxID=134602 RepID=A0ABS3RAB0_9ACTN|nr:sensor histidine kinase [Actinomadura nitritigenes]MBO2442997.1 sensor histidine kinase [Actinomadura nitritigenes]